MKRRNFFKSFAALLGVAIVTPLELFKDKESDFITAIDPHNYRHVRDEKGLWADVESSQIRYYKTWMKLQNHIHNSKPSGELWDIEKFKYYKNLWERSNPTS